MRFCDPTTALTDLRKGLPDTGRIYMPGCSAESTTFIDNFRTTPSLAAGLTFLGVWIPGVNKINYAGLHPDAHAETIFLSPDLRESFENGRTQFRPLSYTQAFRWLAHETSLAAAIIHVTPPNHDGEVSLGVCADFAPALLERTEIKKIALINNEMPAPLKSPRIPLDTFDTVVETSKPILQYTPAPPSSVFRGVAEHIATLINDTDVLQFGLGNVQLSVLKALDKKRNLKIHSGMIADPVLAAHEAGILSQSQNAITTGVALGSDKLYRFCEQDSRLNFQSVSDTHSLETLGAIDNFTAINSVIEVDLFGQANAEYFCNQQISGTGGLVDFLRGAAISKGGKPIIALTSTARRGSISRIVPKLSSPTISINRADTAYVVTEHGVADLRGKTIDERASALIAIADPAYRNQLNAAWHTMKEEL